jgi:hypothetical protein
VQKIFLIPLMTFSIFVGCTTQSDTNRNGKSLLETILVKKEKDVWEAYKLRDSEALRALVSDDSYSIEDADGSIITQAQALKNLPDLSISDYTMQNFKVIPINSGAAIVRYNVKVSGSSKEEKFTPHWSTVSSVWVKRSGKWQNLLYQETEVQHHH